MSDIEYKYHYVVRFESKFGREEYTVDSFPPYSVGQTLTSESWYENGNISKTIYQIENIAHNCKGMKIPGNNEVIVTMTVILSLKEV